MGYTSLKQLRATQTFLEWMNRLQDTAGRARIQMRIDRLAHGNAGNHKRLSARVWELKIDFGPGYRVYYTETGSQLIVLLAGGDKSIQKGDVRMAIEIAKQLDAGCL